MFRGVPLQDICSVATWVSPCTFYRFYKVNIASPSGVSQGVTFQGSSEVSLVSCDIVGTCYPGVSYRPWWLRRVK